MIASPEKPDAVSLSAGQGRIGMRTVVLGAHVIAIDNIGTIRIVRGQRSWWLFALGVIVIAAAATQLNTYGAIAVVGIGFGLTLILAELFQRVESGLSIGTADGRSTLIVSRDQIFLQRLLQLFADKIDNADVNALATFDITTGRITIIGPSVAIGHDVHILEEQVRATQQQAELETSAPAPPPPPPISEDESDDGLFGDAEPPLGEQDAKPAEPGPPPPADPIGPPKPAPVASAAIVQERRTSFDPLLDGARRVPANDDDWLARPRDIGRPSDIQSDGAAGRVLLALLIIVLLGAGVFAAWYFTGQTGPASTLSAANEPREAGLEAPATAEADSAR